VGVGVLMQVHVGVAVGELMQLLQVGVGVDELMQVHVGVADGELMQVLHVGVGVDELMQVLQVGVGVAVLLMHELHVGVGVLEHMQVADGVGELMHVLQPYIPCVR